MRFGIFLLAALLFSLLPVSIFAEAAGWVLIAPPRDKSGNYIRTVPVSRSWTQVGAFDSAAECEAQRKVELETFGGWFGLPDGKTKEEASQEWRDQFLLRCMPYDLWWRAQQPAR